LRRDYAAFPDGESAFNVCGLRCAGRWIFWRESGLLFAVELAGELESSSSFPVFAD